MPFTPYHFGPSGLVGLLFKRRLDLPVFLLANVAVDLEVLLIAGLDLGYPAHRYAHTLLFGAVVGAAWGLAAYPLRPLFARLMRLLRLPYESGLRKMVISGVLGVWLHVLIDTTYHPDVHLLWPSRAWPLWRITYRHITRDQVKDLCVTLLIAAAALYVALLAIHQRRTRRIP